MGSRRPFTRSLCAATYIPDLISIHISKWWKRPQQVQMNVIAQQAFVSEIYKRESVVIKCACWRQIWGGTRLFHKFDAREQIGISYCALRWALHVRAKPDKLVCSDFSASRLKRQGTSTKHSYSFIVCLQIPQKPLKQEKSILSNNFNRLKLNNSYNLEIAKMMHKEKKFLRN